MAVVIPNWTLRFVHVHPRLEDGGGGGVGSPAESEGLGWGSSA